MRSIKFKTKAFSDYSVWSKENKKVFDKIMNLIIECTRTPYEGTGKPEALKHELSNCWSRRITDEHRLVYQVFDEEIVVVSCKYHY